MKTASTRRTVWALVTAGALAAAGGVLHSQRPARAAEATAGPAAPQPLIAAPATRPAGESAHVSAESAIAAGRYIVKVGGCNDCHTPGFAPAGGNVPESQWLTGDAVGFRGPWGTTYPSNLRLALSKVSEDDFVKIARERNTRPPMPWPALHAMSDRDLRAVYQYIRSLPVAGQPAPEWVPPTEEPTTPYVVFVPVMPKGTATPAAK
jgi:mono/diheme cytochrome c family protein